MGCWNKTCGLSNLHIRAGSEVYVFVLEENTDKTDRCYSTAFWKPLLLPFNSVYNDYGGGEESSGPGFELIMNGISNELIEMEVGENEYHDIAVKKEGFGEEQFFESVHEGRLFRTVRQYSKYEPTNVIIDFVMMRKDVVDYILDNRVIEQYVGDGKGTIAKWGSEKNYIQYKFEDILKDLPEFLDALVERINPPGVDKDSAMLSLFFMRGFDGVFDWNHPNKASKWLRGDNYRYSSIVDIQSEVIKLLKLDKRAEAELLMIELLKGKFIDGILDATRRNWAPGGHEGSQADEQDGYRLLMNAVTSALDQEKAEWDEENAEDEMEEA